jgi:Na+-transporting NADH:ubiquinone oxidoreductase subunit F
MTPVLLAALLVFVIAGCFAALLLIAERYLVDYGQCTLEINDGSKEVEVTGGESLLMSLKSEGIYLPSACGGRGTCAYCKCRITEGGGPLSPTELPLLEPQEIERDVRISCQVKVRNDMQIEIPEELLLVQEFKGVAEKITDLTHDIKLIRIRLREPEEITFTPGQYVQLEAPPYGDQRESVFRAYSIASPPYEKNIVELIIRLVPGGICTTYVFEHLSEGDEVSLTGPFGDFRLSETEAEMFWIAGGSGMAPFWSILRQMRRDGVERETHYFFGAVGVRDMFFLDELRELEKELPWFHFVPALSGPKDGEDDEPEWDGERGLITEVVDRHVEQGTAGEGYLCGSPGMIDASIRVLNDKGITEDRIYYDKFA